MPNDKEFCELETQARERNALETAKLLSDEIEVLRKRGNGTTVSFLTLCIVVLGAVLNYASALTWAAIIAICVFLACVAFVAARIVEITRHRTSYAKILRQQLIASLRFPDAFEMPKETERPNYEKVPAFSQDLPPERLCLKFKEAKHARGGLTKSYKQLIIAVAAVTIVTAFLTQALKKNETGKEAARQPVTGTAK
jgi:hypothetical protein